LNNNNRVTTIENSLKEDGTVGSQIAANTAAIQSITGADGSIASAVKNLKEEINESLAGKVDNTQYQLDKKAFAKADSDNL
jgi:phage-related protein